MNLKLSRKANESIELFSNHHHKTMNSMGEIFFLKWKICTENSN